MAATRSYAGTTASATDASTYTFTAHAIGTAAANRKVVVCAAMRSGSSLSVSSLTVGGISASLVVRSAASGTSQVEIWVADVPTGTTADIVVNWSGTAARCGIAVYAMYGAASSTASATATDTAVPFSQSLAIPANGCAFAIQTSSDSIAGSVTWSGLTEDSDAGYGAENQQYGSASKEATASETPTVAVTGPTDGAFCAASFAPAAYAPPFKRPSPRFFIRRF